jgi:hypothetical protein
LFFRGVDLSLIVCVDLSVCELVFMTDKGYCAESSGKTICGKMIHLLEFTFDFMSEVLLYVPSGMSKFDFGPKFLYEIL